MPGSRTAPTIDGNPTFVSVQVRLIDHTGDIRSVTFLADQSQLDADIETYVAALQTITNASVFEVNVAARYVSNPSAADADASSYLSVYDNIVLNLKNPATQRQSNAFVPAPLEALIDGGDRVDVANTDYVAWVNAVNALIVGNAVTVRFTERRDKNDSTPAL
jgi:hypothetical protein